ncbi:MAG: glutamine synthetase family protein [Acidimicrobiia bacterium]|nr:glutamine synthetase family protein [Acidimicrobiia bacterium]MDX2467522.1 glutamine synthetase family protein [Acidimicrobiia bacterium]
MRGFITIEQLRAMVTSEDVDTVVVAFTDHYGRLQGKRYDAEFFLEGIDVEGTHACDYLLTADMEMEPVPGFEFSNWETGYGDFHMVPDLATLRLADWLPGTAIVLCDLHDEVSGDPVSVAPRSMLRKQLERAASMGYSAKAASELEYFIFEDSYRSAATKGYADLNPVGWYNEDYHILQGTREEPYNGAIRRHLSRSGIPVENSKGEWGRGQHEMNIRYAETLEMADRHVLMKQCMKETADEMGMAITFMAKPDETEAGSSCHIHVSLWDGETNAFPGEISFPPLMVSDEFRWFLGGWMDKISELIPLFAPTINSYKRFQAGSWAPTRIAWSHDNRTAGFRIVGHGPSLRIECRVPGADVNPYLAYAAMLAAGLDGIDNKIEPPPIFEGDVYAAAELPEVPKTLRAGLDLFAASEFAIEAFGADVHQHYCHFFETEIAAYDNAVTDWERRRYFERI